MKDWTGTGGAVLAQGIVAGTRIATGTGWRAVETLRQGDPVLTVAAGLQPLAAARPSLFAALPLPVALWPLAVPAGAVGNRCPLVLLPDQRLLIGTEEADQAIGEPFALLPASALEGWRGIVRFQPGPGLGVVTLGFAVPQLVYASRQALVCCAGQAQAEPADILSLSAVQAREVVACLIAADLGRDLARCRDQAAFGSGAKRA